MGLFGLGAIQSHGFWLWLRRNKRRTFEKELLCCVLIRFEVLGILTLYFAKPLHTVFLFVLSLRGTSDKKWIGPVVNFFGLVYGLFSFGKGRGA